VSLDRDQRSKQRLRTWIRLLRATRRIEGELRVFLRVEHDHTLPRFDVLAALYRAGDPMTMGALSQQLLVSNGNTTSIVDRLERDGLVVRTGGDDRRVVLAALTDEGRRQFEAIAAPHETRVDRLLAGLGDDDLADLDRLLHQLEAALPDPSAHAAPAQEDPR
jgi:DNA-binding MarR family transcriptional regulator